MPLTTTKDVGSIGRGGGSLLYARQVQSTGADLATPDTNHDLGHVKTSSISDVTEMLEAFNEAGDQVAYLEDKRNVSLKFDLMQYDANFIDAFKEEVRGKFYRIYYQGKAKSDGGIFEASFGICRIQPRIELVLRDGEFVVLPIEVRVLYNSSQITILNTDLPSVKVTAAVHTIAAGKYWSHTET
jgi:hypothetical protein